MDAEIASTSGIGRGSRTGGSSAAYARASARCAQGSAGLCFVRRAREDGEGMELTGYGRSTGFCVDPIEKKPLNHSCRARRCCRSAPPAATSPALSARTGTSRRAARSRRLSAHAMPETIARAAERLGCASVAYTYNDPVIFMEYALDTAAACRASGVKNVAVTAGFICEEPRKRIFAAMDAANVDLKGVHRALLCKALRRRARAGARYAQIPRARDRRVDRDHDAAHSGRERFGRGDRGADAMGRRES